MRVAAFTGGATVPSARFRVRQYVAPIRALDIDLHEMRTATEAYPPHARWRRPDWAARRIAELLPRVAASHRYDRVLLQREMISTFRTLETWTGRPRILDVDDAVHLERGGGFIASIATACDRVICGNAWLAERYATWCKDVVVLPTGIDADRYAPGERSGGGPLVIGWIGTSANFPYLEQLEPALNAVLSRHADVRLRVVADRPPRWRTLPEDRWSFARWNEAAEVAELQGMDIGIMPLADSDWARGKCSFKMLQYMACGKPVVVSPVGMNAEVLAMGDVGAGPIGTDEWVDALAALVLSREEREAKGAAGRRVVEARFSTAVLAPQFARHLRDI